MRDYYRWVFREAVQTSWKFVWQHTRGTVVITLPAVFIAVFLALSFAPGIFDSLGLPAVGLDYWPRAFFSLAMTVFWAMAVFLIALAVNLVRTPFLIWKGEKKEKGELQQKITELRSLGPLTAADVYFEDGPTARFLRLRVDNDNAAPVDGCFVKAVRFQMLESMDQSGAVPPPSLSLGFKFPKSSWSPGGDWWAFSIGAGDREYVDIAIRGHSNWVFEFAGVESNDQNAPRRGAFFQRPGRYELGLEIGSIRERLPITAVTIVVSFAPEHDGLTGWLSPVIESTSTEGAVVH